MTFQPDWDSQPSGSRVLARRNRTRGAPSNYKCYNRFKEAPLYENIF